MQVETDKGSTCTEQMEVVLQQSHKILLFSLSCSSFLRPAEVTEMTHLSHEQSGYYSCSNKCVSRGEIGEINGEGDKSDEKEDMDCCDGRHNTEVFIVKCPRPFALPLRRKNIWTTTGAVVAAQPPAQGVSLPLK